MDPLFTALVTALGAVVGGLAVYLATRRRIEFEERTGRQATELEAARLIRRYRDPLISAAFDLQSRLYNIVVVGFLRRYLVEGSPNEQEYARESTLYVLAEYLGWVEIIRCEIQFLDVGDQESKANLAARLHLVRQIMFDESGTDDTFRVFRAEQRAIGEIMITTSPNGTRECLGFASFVSHRARPDFSKWFAKLDADIDRLASEPGLHHQRLVDLQHALIELLDFLDPEHLRFETRNRHRIPAST